MKYSISTLGIFLAIMSGCMTRSEITGKLIIPPYDEITPPHLVLLCGNVDGTYKCAKTVKPYDIERHPTQYRFRLSSCAGPLVLGVPKRDYERYVRGQMYPHLAPLWGICEGRERPREKVKKT